MGFGWAHHPDDVVPTLIRPLLSRGSSPLCSTTRNPEFSRQNSRTRPSQQRLGLRQTAHTTPPDAKEWAQIGPWIRHHGLTTGDSVGICRSRSHCTAPMGWAEICSVTRYPTTVASSQMEQTRRGSNTTHVARCWYSKGDLAWTMEAGALNGQRGGITEAAHLGDERTTLAGFLQHQRDVVAWKLRDAADDVLRSVATPTGLTLHGIVRHLEHVERSWIRDDFAGESDLIYAWSDDDPDGDLHVPPDVPIATLLRDYAVESARCDEIISSSSLDSVSVRGNVSLRWILLHLIEETSRHLGHIDLLREQADGQVGDEPGSALPQG